METLLIACPKCAKGDLFLNKDMYGAYVQCLQCGYLKEINVKRPIKTRSAPPRRTARTAVPAGR